MSADPLSRGTSQTPTARVSDIDYSTWLTKTQAATALGVTTKTVERLAADGQIQQGATQRQGRGPTLAVYHPDDVARIASARHPAPAAFVLPPGVTGPVTGNGHGASQALAVTPQPPPPGDDVLRLLFAAALRAVSETSETCTLFVTIPQAAAILGLPQADVRRLCHDGDLNHRLTGRGGIRIRRKDLEAL